MSASPDGLAGNRSLIAYTAAAMYAGAALDELMTGFIPGDPMLSLSSLLAAVAIVSALVIAGPRLPRWALATFGPLGVLLIAQALAGAPRAGDAAVLYMWPVVWMSFFFGRRGAIAIVATIGLAHALVLLTLSGGAGYAGRWLEVMISVSVVAVVIVRLAERNQRLLRSVAGEARVDALTGLMNRRGYDERAAVEVARARRTDTPMTVAMFDIDHFKRINDQRGHKVGDRVLARTGRVLVEAARDIDLVARLGGEEFVVLSPGWRLPDAHAFAERVRVAMRAGGPADVPAVRISVGIDAAGAAHDATAMLKRADLALYEAKRAGRDRIVAFAGPDPSPSTAARRTRAADPWHHGSSRTH